MISNVLSLNDKLMNKSKTCVVEVYSGKTLARYTNGVFNRQKKKERKREKNQFLFHNFKKLTFGTI